MNDLDMKDGVINDLMLHVERIVRPVSATQRRKLRMRLELLGHLRETLDEERSRHPNDAPAAIEQAKRRLGDPAELSKTLQETVPVAERVLLARVRVPNRLDRLEHRLAQVPGQGGAMTLGHKSVLLALVMLPFAPLLLIMLSATTRGVPAIHFALSLIGTLAGWLVLLLASRQFVFAALSADKHGRWVSTALRGVLVVALEVGLTIFATFAIADRAATMREILIGAASTIVVLTASTFIAGRIATLRRPYDEWLTLDIAR